MWTKLDDGFPDHPKIIALSDAAFRVLVRSCCYSSRYLTDGRIASSWVRQFPKDVRAELVAAGCWERESADSYVIHDFLDYNPSRTEVQVERQRRSEAGRKGAAARWQMPSDSHGQSHGTRDGEQGGEHVAVLVLDPSSSSSSSLSKTTTKQEQKPLRSTTASGRDLIFEGLCEACGMDWHELTEKERAKVNTAAKQLRILNPSAEEIMARSDRWPDVMGDATKTPIGIASNWARLNGTARAGGRRSSFQAGEAIAQELERREHEAERSDAAHEQAGRVLPTGSR